MIRATGSTDATSETIPFDHNRQTIEPIATALTSPKSKSSSPAEGHLDWVGRVPSIVIAWPGTAPGADVDAGGSVPAPGSFSIGLAGGSGSAFAGASGGARSGPGRAISGQSSSFGPIARNVSP